MIILVEEFPVEHWLTVNSQRANVGPLLSVYFLTVTGTSSLSLLSLHNDVTSPCRTSENTRGVDKVGVMLAQRQGRWANITPTLLINPP